jgi:hypothetical protein
MFRRAWPLSPALGLLALKTSRSRFLIRVSTRGTDQPVGSSATSGAQGIFRHARTHMFCSNAIHEKANPPRGGDAKPRISYKERWPGYRKEALQCIPPHHQETVRSRPVMPPTPQNSSCRKRLARIFHAEPIRSTAPAAKSEVLSEGASAGSQGRSSSGARFFVRRTPDRRRSTNG